jgi:hypothetical protein
MVLLMTCALFAACGGNSGGGGNTDPTPNTPSVNDQPEVRRYANTRTIRVAIWWDTNQIYDSNRTTFTDSESDVAVGQMRLDNMRAIEDRYNIKLEFVDMTYVGARESISTSVMAGAPDVDIYTMDFNFGIPYILNGFCMPTDEYAKPGSDIFTDQIVFTPVNVCSLPKDYIFVASPPVDYNQIYMLGFNWDLLQEYNQPNPQDLWDEGKWTWTEWLEIMRAVTDGTKGTYGWAGTHVKLLENMLISNNTGIALTDTQGLTSPATLDVLDFIYKMYNENNVAKPWDPDGDFWAANNDWSTGKAGFFLWIPWLAQNYGITKGYGTASNAACDYVIRTVPWPIGPNGNKDTNRQFNLGGNVYMIPIGTKDADIVYDTLYDYHNWYDFDLDLRNDATFWVEDLYGDDIRGFELVQFMGTKPQFDMFDYLNAKNADGDGFGVGGLLGGYETPAQLAETWKNIMQDYIDVAYGKKK